MSDEWFPNKLRTAPPYEQKYLLDPDKIREVKNMQPKFKVGDKVYVARVDPGSYHISCGIVREIKITDDVWYMIALMGGGGAYQVQQNVYPSRKEAELATMMRELDYDQNYLREEQSKSKHLNRRINTLKRRIAKLKEKLK